MAGKKPLSKSERSVETCDSGGLAKSKTMYISDKRLVPRMKEYIKELENTGHVDIDEMAAVLQSSYPEYSRKKKRVFRKLVGLVYRSLTQSNQLRKEEEDWLERRERKHFEKRMKANEKHDNDTEELFSDDDSDDVMDLEMDATLSQELESNTMNDQILQVYRSSAAMTSANDVTQTDSMDCGSEPITPSLHVAENTLTLALSENKPPSTLSSDPKQLDLPHTASVLAHMTTTSGDDDNKKNQTLSGDANASGIIWQQIPKTPPPDMPPGSLRSCLKKVSFSTPEVTGQCQFEELESNLFGSEHRSYLKSKKSKKRHRHHEGDRKEEVGRDEGAEERSKVKKRKMKEESSSIKDGLRERHSSEFKVITSSVRFSDVGGCDKVTEEVSKLFLHLQIPQLFTWLGVRPPQGFLLHGPPGCGKTLLAHAIAGELNLPFIKLASTEIVSGVSGEAEQTLRDLFSLAASHAPSVLFIDEIDAICRKRETAHREMERRIVTQLLSCLDDLNQSNSNSRVLVIGATSSPDSLDPALRRAGRFDREISLGIPDQSARESILKVLGRGLRLEDGFSFHSISHQTPGFVGADLMALVREASLCAVNRVLPSSKLQDGTKSDQCIGPEVAGGVSCGRNLKEVSTHLKHYSSLSEEQLSSIFIKTQDFLEALKIVQPSAKREGFATVPDITWDDVGALESIREELSISILAPVRYPDQFASLGLTMPPGILLAGPPGCGKTLLAKAVANESGINFISVKGPELLNMYVGESERAVRQVFQRARNSAPCVIFFDELDALCPKRSDMAESSASSRVVNQLLTEMDGLVARKQVFIMGATNRPDIIDPAVLRPGRLDKILYVGLPSAKDRIAILNTITKFGTRPQLGQDVELELLASDQHSKGYSGADLSALVREAAIIALLDHMQLNPLSMSSLSDVQSDNRTADECFVEMKHFVAASAKIRPSVSKKDQIFYEQMARNFS